MSRFILVTWNRYSSQYPTTAPLICIKHNFHFCLTGGKTVPFWVQLYKLIWTKMLYELLLSWSLPGIWCEQESSLGTQKLVTLNEHKMTLPSLYSCGFYWALYRGKLWWKGDLRAYSCFSVDSLTCTVFVCLFVFGKVDFVA